MWVKSSGCKNKSIFLPCFEATILAKNIVIICQFSYLCPPNNVESSSQFNIAQVFYLSENESESIM